MEDDLRTSDVDRGLRTSEMNVAPTLWGVVAASARLNAFASLYGMLLWVESDLATAFYRSLVVCSRTSPSSGCPKGSIPDVTNTSCVSVGRGSADWSGSTGCFDHDLVITRATTLAGQLASVNTSMMLASLFLLGPRIDFIGRRAVIVLGLVGFGVTAACWLGAAALPRGLHHGQLALLFVGVAAGSVLNSGVPACNAMCNDLAAAHVAVQGRAVAQATRNTFFTVLSFSRNLGTLSAFGVGYALLTLDLINYQAVWLGATVLALAAAAACHLSLRETLPAQPTDADAHTGSPTGTRHLAREMREAVQLVVRDPFLRQFIPITLVVVMAIYGSVTTTGGYLIKTLKLTQSVASLAGIVNPTAMALAYAAAPAVTRCNGAARVYALGLCLMIVGFAVAGFSAVVAAAGSVGVGRFVFWLGWVLTGFGFGFVTPSGLTLVSMRVVAQHSVGQVMSLLQAVVLVGTTIGNIVWTNVVFGRAPSGWRTGSFYFLSAALQLIALPWFVLIASPLLRLQLRPSALAHLASECGASNDDNDGSNATLHGAADTMLMKAPLIDKRSNDD